MFLFAIEIWFLFFLFVASNCDEESSQKEKERFYQSAKTFMLCNICLEIQNGNFTSARCFLRQVIELNNRLGRGELDGLPAPIQTVTDPPPTEKSRISNLFNHRENVLQRLAQGSGSQGSGSQGSGTVTYTFSFDEKFCGSLNCDGFGLSEFGQKKR